MERDTQQKGRRNMRIFTIPNLLSLFRLCLVPAIAWLYMAKDNSLLAGGLLVLSGVTDIADGYIARHFHMVSNLGKILDPVADKVTQAAMLICLLFRFPLMALPLVFLALKEVCMAVTAALVIRRTGVVPQALWHGKLATILLYAMMLLHVFWPDIPIILSTGLLAVCTLMIGVSCILYLGRYLPVMIRKTGRQAPCTTAPHRAASPRQTVPGQYSDERGDGHACTDP